MSTGHKPTRIEETEIYYNLCGEEFWTQIDMKKTFRGAPEGKPIDNFKENLILLNK